MKKNILKKYYEIKENELFDFLYGEVQEAVIESFVDPYEWGKKYKILLTEDKIYISGPYDRGTTILPLDRDKPIEELAEIDAHNTFDFELLEPYQPSDLCTHEKEILIESIFSDPEMKDWSREASDNLDEVLREIMINRDEIFTKHFKKALNSKYEQIQRENAQIIWDDFYVDDIIYQIEESIKELEEYVSTWEYEEE